MSTIVKNVISYFQTVYTCHCNMSPPINIIHSIMWHRIVNVFLGFPHHLKKSKFFFFIYFLYKIEIILYHNLNVYVCEAPFWRLELRPLPPLPPHPKNTYTCGVTIVPRMCDGKERTNSLGNIVVCSIISSVPLRLE